MDTEKTKKKIVSKAILKTEETETPDSTVSDVTPEEASDTQTSVKENYKSKRKTPLKEFAFEHSLRPETVAGFRIWLQTSGKSEFHFDSEWTTLLDEYQNRTL